MAKKKIENKQVANDSNAVTHVPHKHKSIILENRYLPYCILFIFTCLIYSNCLKNKYAIDDTLVLTDNKFTKKGTAGLNEIMTNDAFVGFFGEKGSTLVSGGRYRPLSMATFAIEYEITRKLRGDKRERITDENVILGDELKDPYLNPALSHGINVLLFALTCLLLYHLLRTLMTARKETPFYATLSFITALLFAAHPIHTEAVTNIKGRDEVMGLLFGLGALYCVIKFVKNQNLLLLILGAVFMMAGLLSKENVITFMAIIPITLFFFTKAKGNDYGMPLVLYAMPVLIFFGLRYSFLHAGLSAESPEILNNPFAYCKGFEERYATIIYSFLLYLKVLIFPHPLSHDYYFNQIPYQHFTDFGFIASLFINVGLFIYAILRIRKKTIPSYAILFYFITFSVVSNLIFTVGVVMNERFMYFSSVGFCLLLAYSIIKILDKLKWSVNKIAPIIAGIIVLLYSIKTYSRNADWVTNYNLFVNDVKYSPNSSKLQTSVGGDMTKEADNEPDTINRKVILREAIVHLKKAIEIYPNHSNAWLLLGNATYKLNKNAQEVMPFYENAAKFRVGGYFDAWYNIGCVQIESGDAANAKVNFLKALKDKPDQFECKYNLAEAYNKLGQPDSAILWYQQSLVLKPTDANCLYKIGTIYGKQLNKLDSAIVYIKKAIEMNPKVEVYYEDLGVAYGMKGRYDEAIDISNKCIAVFPKYAPAYQNLAVSYRNKGNMNLFNENLAKANQLRTNP